MRKKDLLAMLNHVPDGAELHFQVCPRAVEVWLEKDRKHGLPLVVSGSLRTQTCKQGAVIVTLD